MPIVLNDYDVLLGRDKECFNHVGNKHFRNYIAENVARYLEAPTRADKSTVVNSLLYGIHEKGGRFLKRSPDTKEWTEVEDRLARDKCSHAVRDAANTMAKRGELPTVAIAAAASAMSAAENANGSTLSSTPSSASSVPSDAISTCSANSSSTKGNRVPLSKMSARLARVLKESTERKAAMNANNNSKSSNSGVTPLSQVDAMSSSPKTPPTVIISSPKLTPTAMTPKASSLVTPPPTPSAMLKPDVTTSSLNKPTDTSTDAVAASETTSPPPLVLSSPQLATPTQLIPRSAVSIVSESSDAEFSSSSSSSSTSSISDDDESVSSSSSANTNTGNKLEDTETKLCLMDTIESGNLARRVSLDDVEIEKLVDDVDDDALMQQTVDLLKNDGEETVVMPPSFDPFIASSTDALPIIGQSISSGSDGHAVVDDMLAPIPLHEVWFDQSSTPTSCLEDLAADLDVLPECSASSLAGSQTLEQQQQQQHRDCGSEALLSELLGDESEAAKRQADQSSAFLMQIEDSLDWNLVW